MFRVRSLVVSRLIVGGILALVQQIHYNVGKSATSEQILSRDISVAPDGTGLPTGTEQQRRAAFSSWQSAQVVTGGGGAYNHRWSCPSDWN